MILAQGGREDTAIRAILLQCLFTFTSNGNDDFILILNIKCGLEILR